jgi:preprotein translocase subunit SecB
VKADQIDLTDQNAALPILRVLVNLGVRVVNLSVPEESEPAPLFQIEATFQLDYAITGQVDSTALNEFSRFNAVQNVWPFWRQYVFSMASQAGLPTPEIPLNTSLQSLENLVQESV